MAVLAPRNERCVELVDELSQRKLEVVDSLLRSSSATRASAGVLANLLRYLSDPGRPPGWRLSIRYGAARRDDDESERSAWSMPRAGT